MNSMCNLPTTQRLQYAVCLSNGLLRPLYTAKLVADFSSFFFCCSPTELYLGITGGGSSNGTAVNLKTAPVQGDDFSSGTSSRKFLVPLVILLYLPPYVHFSFTGSRFLQLSRPLLGVTHIPLLWSCPPAAGQHNDARMNLAIALTAARYGAAIANYTEVVHLLERADPQTGKERVCGAHCRDVITGQEFDVRAKCVINATGPFTDALWKMDDQKNPDICQPSAGVHIVIPHKTPRRRRIIFYLTWGASNTPSHSKSSLERISVSELHPQLTR
uniref:glycerol-3-phosphate dehydrogenase n=1 Tax=Neolamprologus brichardi TaxID=32507 RepID=A0A3Q4HIB2_NEOBR